MGTGGWELVTTNELAAMSKPLLDSIVVKNGQGDGGLANPSGADESDWTKVFGEMDYLLDQLLASKESPRWRGRGFSGYTGSLCEMAVHEWLNY